MDYAYWFGVTPRPSRPNWIHDTIAGLQMNSWKGPLYIDGCHWDQTSIREEVALTLLQSLGRNTSVSSLIFQNAAMNHAMDETLSNALRQNTGLKALKIRNLTTTTTTTNEGPTSYCLPDTTFSNQNLECVNLDNVTLSVQVCRNLSQMIRESLVLHSIAIKKVQFEEGGLIAILASLAFSRSVTSLTINSVELCQTDIKRLLVATSLNHSIKNLHLEGMNLDSQDSVDIAKLMQRNTTIKELSLRQNNLDSDALSILVSQGLLANNSLESLFLSRNPLGDSSHPYISKLLTEQTSLKRLCLVTTDLTEKGCVEVAKALKHNTLLCSIAMDGNDDVAFGNAVVQSLEYNTKLTSVLERLPSLLAQQQDRCNSSCGQSVVWKQVDFYLRANQSNRRLWQSNELQCDDIPYLLECAGTQADLVFHFLQSSANRFLITAAAPTISSQQPPPPPPLQYAKDLHPQYSFVPCPIRLTTTRSNIPSLLPPLERRIQQFCPPGA